MANAFADIARRQLRTAGGKSESRRKLMMAVRAAANRMQLTDEDRRAIQMELTGKTSMADMTPAEIGQVLDRLNRDRPAPMGHRAHVAKIRALWWTLYWLGETAEPNDQALDAFTRRQTGLSALRFVDHRSAPALIEALKAWTARAGVNWYSDAHVAEIAAGQARSFSRAKADRCAVVEAIWEKLRDAREVHDSIPWIYLRRSHGLNSNHLLWSERELDTCIRGLGKQLRRHLGKRSV